MKMQERKLKKFTVYSKIANVLFILIVVFGSIITAAALGGAIFLAATDSLTDVTSFITQNILPSAGLILPEGIPVSYGVIFVMIIQLASVIVLTAYIFKSVALIFRNTTEDKTPFTAKTVRFVKGIGIAFLIYAGIILVLSIISGAIAPEPAFNTTINGRMILVGLLVLLIGEIFEFGTNLQQDSESIV